MSVTCTWMILVMPVFGTAACIAGGIVVIQTKSLPLGTVVIPLLGIPAAFYFHGIEAGLLMTAVAVLMLSRHYKGLAAYLRRAVR